MFGKLSSQHNVLDANDMPDHDDEMYYTPFKYLHLGSLAYIGNSYVTLPTPYQYLGHFPPSPTYVTKSIAPPYLRVRG